MSESRASTGARKVRWEDLEADHPVPLLERRRIHAERMTVARVHLLRGFKIDPHSHEEEQIAVVLSGKIRFLVGEPQDRKEILLGADELLHFPSNVPHGAEALEDSLVLDIFSPPARETGIDRAGD
jgi:quercetin dioxygenase-like cupin family protein